ncbi:aminoglycoside 6-adenylyltransferase [Paenibacillus yanchengensis]|uniref:Aminoglycoside 6-adenylyltransferase n=1 Tax=Paenibacillus yanchengensis TaxID=2035833 RepID=A0ABW4YQM0_9BACL
MRSEQEIMQMLLQFAQSEQRIRLVTLEGSRTNKQITKDGWQDYDVSFFVTDLVSFQQDDDWLHPFGERLMMQKPEDMELFLPELGNWFSYLIIFADGVKLDLTLIPLDEVDRYFAESDGLVEVLLDKDNLIRQPIVATDQQYWIKPPTARQFDDCCNEFWFVSTYVVKGLARGELLFAIDHLHEIARPNLLRMIGWHIGCERGFTFSIGKNYKFIDQFMQKEDWNLLLTTYENGTIEQVWQSLFTCYELFRQYSLVVATDFNYPYPNYDSKITAYTKRIYFSDSIS